MTADQADPFSQSKSSSGDIAQSPLAGSPLGGSSTSDTPPAQISPAPAIPITPTPIETSSETKPQTAEVIPDVSAQSPLGGPSPVAEPVATPAQEAPTTAPAAPIQTPEAQTPISTPLETDKGAKKTDSKEVSNVKELQMEDPFEPEKKLNYTNVIILFFGLIIIALIVFIIYGYGQLPKKDSFIETLLGTSSDTNNENTNGSTSSNQDNVSGKNPKDAWITLSSDDYKVEGSGKIEIDESTEELTSTFTIDYSGQVGYYDNGVKTRTDDNESLDMSIIAQQDGKLLGVDDSVSEYYVLYTTEEPEQNFFFHAFYSDPLTLVYKNLKEGITEFSEVETNIWESELGLQDPLTGAEGVSIPINITIELDSENALVTSIEAFNDVKSSLGKVVFVYEEVDNMDELTAIPDTYTEGSLY